MKNIFKLSQYKRKYFLFPDRTILIAVQAFIEEEDKNKIKILDEKH